MYIWDKVASVTQPVKKLKGFQKIFLKKGESRKVTFTISEEELKFYNSDLKWVSEPGAFTVYIGTNSQDVKSADFKLLK
jgi:beta-glucosidase